MGEGEHQMQESVPLRLLKGLIPILIVCLFIWGLAKEPSPSPMAVLAVFVACALVLWFGWNSIRRNLATKWLSLPLIILVGLVLGMFVFGLALGVAVNLCAALLLALPYLVYDLFFRQPNKGRIEHERSEGHDLPS